MYHEEIYIILKMFISKFSLHSVIIKKERLLFYNKLNKLFTNNCIICFVQ